MMMNMKRRFLKYFAMASVLMMAVACKPEVELVNLNFASEMEQPTANDSTKTYLAMERYIHWESTDEIKVYSGDGGYSGWSNVRDVAVSPRADARYADIDVPGFEYADHYYGVFPASAAFDDNPKMVRFLSDYAYTGSDPNQGQDLTYPKPGFPMVAYHDATDRWYHGTENEELPAFDFHSLCGLARIQFTVAAGLGTKNISKIEFTKVDGAEIAGVFSVANIDKYEPTVAFSSDGTTVTFNCSNTTVAPGKLITLYLPLPATSHSVGATAGNPNTQAYNIKMSIYDDQNNVFSKSFRVNIRRNSLSYVRAITIDSWNNTSTNATVGMVGCGTELRPFQIYMVDDLKKVRAAFTGNKTINGVAITSDTYFRVVRSDIVLNESNWDGGIANFEGHFIYKAGHATDAGITNTSKHPIFESISGNGSVEGLTVKGTITSTTGTEFSPFCNVNEGRIEDCRFAGSLTSATADLAGLCCTNKGNLVNCSNTGTINASGAGRIAAGICLANQGTIQAFNLSSSNVKAAKAAAGICYTNAAGATVQNSQITLTYGTVTPITYQFGGIVFVNNGTIKNCEVLGQIYSTEEVGGICHTNNKLIDACRIGISTMRGANNQMDFVGGVAARQLAAGAEIRNCFNSAQMTANVQAVRGTAGGIVGKLEAGNVFNCYTDYEVAYATSYRYGMIVGDATGGLVENCYAGRDLANFYGTSLSGQIGRNCFNAGNQALEVLTACCTYKWSDGEIMYLTANSKTLDAGVQYHVDDPATTGDNMGKALNKWVAAQSNPSLYFNWTETGRPTFSSSAKTKKRSK